MGILKRLLTYLPLLSSAALLFLGVCGCALSTASLLTPIPTDVGVDATMQVSSSTLYFGSAFDTYIVLSNRLDEAVVLRRPHSPWRSISMMSFGDARSSQVLAAVIKPGVYTESSFIVLKPYQSRKLRFVTRWLSGTNIVHKLRDKVGAAVQSGVLNEGATYRVIDAGRYRLSYTYRGIDRDVMRLPDGRKVPVRDHFSAKIFDGNVTAESIEVRFEPAAVAAKRSGL